MLEHFPTSPTDPNLLPKGTEVGPYPADRQITDPHLMPAGVEAGIARADQLFNSGTTDPNLLPVGFQTKAMLEGGTLAQSVTDPNMLPDPTRPNNTLRLRMNSMLTKGIEKAFRPLDAGLDILSNRLYATRAQRVGEKAYEARKNQHMRAARFARSTGHTALNG